MAGVARLLAQRAKERPDRTAYLSGPDGRRLTWADLAREAVAMQALGLPPAARVGILAADPLEFAAIYLGVLAAGRTAVPLDARLTPPELSAATARLRVDVTLTEVPVRRTPHRFVDHPSVLLTSSGTTGRPMGIALSEAQLLHAARRVARHHQLGPGERGYSPLPLTDVDAQVMGLLATLVSGASLVLDPRFEAGAYWERVARWRPTWLNTGPAMLAVLAARPAPPAGVVERIRFARSAAELPVPTGRAFTATTGIGVLQTYGMTEAAGQITANPLDPADRREGSVGLPVEVGLAVLGPDGIQMPVGETGMIALHGPAVAAHYLIPGPDGTEQRRPASDAFGWLPTGDLGYRDEDGFLYLTGRAAAAATVAGRDDPRLGPVPAMAVR